MSRRAVILGLLCALGVAGFSSFNDFCIRQNFLIPNLMPIVLYGGLILFLLVVQPVLGRLRPTVVLSGRELAVIAAFVLAACFVPGRGLMHCMPTSIMLPHHYARINPGWRAEDAIASAPARMLADVDADGDVALTGYVTGLAQGDEHIGLSDVPWGAWRGTLCFWVPLVLSIAIGSIGLALVVHRQWADHEHLPYPISLFAGALLQGEGRSRGSLFRDRLFVAGLGVVLFVHMNNYAHSWWPDYLVRIPRNLDFTPLASRLPLLVRGGGWMLLRPLVIFSVFGLSYFLASDVSLSLGTVAFVYCTVSGILQRYGVTLRSGHHLSLKIESFLFAGGYFGILLAAIYTGRYHYWNVLCRSLRLPWGGGGVRPGEVWGMRVFLGGSMLFALQLVLIGLDWRLALIYTGLVVTIYVVVSRTIAETGAYFIGTEVFPGAIIWGFFGASALGPETMVIMFMVGVVLLAGPGWAAMPFSVQAFKLVDASGVRVPKIACWTALIVVLSLAVALPLTLYWHYDRGAMASADGWGLATPRFPFENVVEVKQTLSAQGLLEGARAVRGWRRFSRMRPAVPCVSAFGIATLIAVGLAIGRLRFAWWPLHPVIFVFLGGYQSMVMAGSFLLGWLFKTVVMKYGGARLYQRLKPLMLGLIAGDMLAGIIPMIIGAVYYLVTNEMPKSYWISSP